MYNSYKIRVVVYTVCVDKDFLNLNLARYRRQIHSISFGCGHNIGIIHIQKEYLKKNLQQIACIPHTLTSSRSKRKKL